MRRLRWIGAGVALSLAAGASQAAVMGDIAIFIDFVGWIGQGTAQLAAQQILDNQTVAENAEIVGGNEIADWVEARIDDGKMDMIITFGGFPDDLYAAGNAEPDGSLAEEFLYGGNFFLNTADYIFYYSNGIQNGDVALKNITNSNFDMWTDGNASQPTPDGEKYLPSMGNFSAPRAFKRDQIEANPEWEIEIVFGDNTGDGNGVFMDPVVIRNVETDGRIGIIMQVSNDALNRGEVMTEFLNNWLAEVVEALGVDPKGKLPTLWGALKSR